MQLNGAKIRDYYRLGSDINTEDAAATIFRVPHFQRPYKWTSNEIQSLIKDHSENEDSSQENSPYFAGAIVTAVEEDCHSLIDGQQRYTTLFLANYLRFLLYRSYFAVAIDRRHYKAIEHADKFENVSNYIFFEQEFVSSEFLKECIDLVMEDDSRCSEIREKYLEKVFLPRISNDNEGYVEEHYNLVSNKLMIVNLLLDYDRKTFNEQLKEALSRISILHSSESGPSLELHDLGDVDPSVNIYINAIHTLFCCFHDRAKETSNKDAWNKNAPYRITQTIAAIDRFMRDLRFCVVQTGKKEDAYTLFEVLNDRALSLDDLDIVKNYFYKKYVLWSQKNFADSESNEKIDKTLEDLDELWGDNVFGQKPEYHKRLVSYLAVVYLSGAKNLTSDRGPALRQSVKNYLGSREKYMSPQLRADFQVFSNVDIFVTSYGLRGKLKEKSAIESICSNETSYIKKFFVLTHALDMPGIMPGVMSPLLKAASGWAEADLKDNIEKTSKKNEAKLLVPKIEKLAFYLFKHVLASSDYKKARELVVDKVIGQICSTSTLDVDSLSIRDFKISQEELEGFVKWSTSWQYSKTALGLRIRILLLILLGSKIKRDEIDGDKLELNNAFNTIPKDPDSLTLDHLEPSNPNKTATKAFFEDEERHRIVNSLGNMMLLDASSNTKKNNGPMVVCFDVLEESGLKDHWMTEDISSLLDDYHTLEDGKKVPKKEFFSNRGKKLRNLMTCVLMQNYEERSVKVYDK